VLRLNSDSPINTKADGRQFASGRNRIVPILSFKDQLIALSFIKGTVGVGCGVIGKIATSLNGGLL
jgi:hypothetical protein